MAELRKSPWPGWVTVQLIGRGSFGAVYEIRRELVDGTVEAAAMKVITIPQNPEDISEMYGEGYDSESITASFRAHLKSIVAEYTLMQKLEDSANVVNCKDICYIQHDDGIGWDIFIRMELLTPLMKALPDSTAEETILKIGRDICSALVLCKKYGIIHRDIKPQNIFVSPNGGYKLGDFGIAKTVEKTMGGTKIGTYKYMAPEVYNNQPYGSGADIYSLGLVLYWLLNEHRMPFMPLPPAKILAGQDEQARQRRLTGERLPPPAHGSAMLKRIVLKACAYAPEDRFGSAEEMRLALQDCLRTPAAPQKQRQQPLAPLAPIAEPTVIGTPIAEPTVIDTPTEFEYETATQAVIPQQRPAEKKAPEERKAPAGKEKKKRKSGKPAWAALCVLLLCCGLLTVWQFTYGAQAQEAKESYLSAQRTTTLAAGSTHTVGLRDNGTVVATGRNYHGQLNVSGWTNIVAVSAGNSYTVGLRNDGTVVAVGLNDDGQCNTGSWKNIVAISAGYNHTVGLRGDGTVVVTGNNAYGQCNVTNWTGIVAISAGYAHTVGLRSDGTVVTAGRNSNGQCSTGSWKDIVAISAGRLHTVGLRSNGTVVSTGVNLDGQCNTDSWNNIVAISAGGYHTAGLRSNGTVVVAGAKNYGQSNTGTWTDIVAVNAGYFHTVGLRDDGTVVAVGSNAYGQCDVSGWKNIRVPG